jgi:predicted metal-binding membrane protein
MMKTTSPIVGGTLIAVAGAYQFSPLKTVCLKHCRSPLAFLLTRWRDGNQGALRMGFEHGIFCLGCCWALMVLLFVGGVMNLFWVAAIALFVLLEKLVPRGDLWGRLGGGALMVVGAALAFLA